MFFLYSIFYDCLKDEIILFYVVCFFIFYISIIIEQLTNKFQVFFRKKRGRCTGLHSTLIFELNQMNSVKIMDGSVSFAI